ncbi:MAG: porphobilinogen synthase [Candidatus Omnitrophica bacterium]|nr:porphobilinogen synthase [Candidatus Omnitrophota bacterium]
MRQQPSRTHILKKLLPRTAKAPAALIMPYFVVEGKGVKNPVVSMPGVCQLSVDLLVKEVAAAKKLGMAAVILFGVPALKDLAATAAYDAEGIVQQAVRAIKKAVPGILVITDVCLCAYTSHGHCGIIREGAHRLKGAFSLAELIDLEKTLASLAATALSHVEAGADMVAPSAMMRGQVKAIRKILDKNGFLHIPIMGYSAKFASSFYGPFRDAAGSAPKFGDRRAYQLDPASAPRALAQVRADIREGADIVMVKPALAYLDIIRRVKDGFDRPLAAYNVSGEYAMVKAAAHHGWIDEKKMVPEILNGIRRAGADIIITYHACDMARWMKERT